MMRRWLFILLAVLLVACEAEPTFIPTATPTVLLEQMYSGTDLVGGTIQASYPSNWQQGGTPDNLLLTNDPNILANPQADMPLGSVALSVITLPTSLAGLSVAEGQSPTPYNILLRFLQTAQQTSPTAIFGEPALTTINGQAAALAQGSDGTDETHIWVINLGAGVAVVAAVANKGDLINHLSTIEAILNSLQYGN